MWTPRWSRDRARLVLPFPTAASRARATNPRASSYPHGHPRRYGAVALGRPDGGDAWGFPDSLPFSAPPRLECTDFYQIYARRRAAYSGAHSG